MPWLKQSTAVTLKIGPFIDEDDGKTAETGLTISQADVRLSKNGANIAQKNESTSCTHDELGYYGCPIDAGDTDTLGTLQLFVHESGALPVWHEFVIVPANVWDSFFSTDKLQVHAAEISAGLITAAAIATGAIDAGAIAADAIGASELAADAVAEIADALLDEALSDHDSEDTLGNVLNDLVEESGGTYRLTAAALQSTLGAGAITFTYTLTSTVDASAIPDADIWVTTDSGGSIVVASGRTDSNGEVVFYLDAGTYYVWRQKSGFNFTNPDTETVA